METFYDGDLKDIWDSDLDPTESLKISTDHDMHDWLFEREVKDPAVILNDKLISDALLNGTLPIKSEHSYSLNSDGDSLPGSPRSLHAKMDDMDDECYPAISLKTATSNLRSHLASATIDPKCLTLHPPTSISCSPVAVSTLGFTRATNALLGSSNTISIPAAAAAAAAAASAATTTAPTLGLQASSGFGRIASSMTLNLRNSTLLEQQQQQLLQQQQHQQQLQLQLKSANANGSSSGSGGTLDLQAAHQQYLPQYDDNDCGSSVSTRDGSISPDICSDIEIDESCIKDEPLSPNSSCPASPNSQNSDLSAASVAHLASELIFENKHGSLQLTPTSQSFLKSQQQLLLGNQNALIVPKITVKSEKQQQQQSANLLYTTATLPKSNSNAYGIPLTPPSSLPSDESEGNLTPEHLFSPLSPTASVSISVATLAANGALATATATTTASSLEHNTRRSSHAQAAAAAMGANGRNASGGSSSSSSTSTRQPIHTPLISSQPKGSTGMLLLTEEEKRTLLAEGYPIPQKLPLTKAEEKSLKKIRRKIKNKISAQESRRKKKEYMDQLERRVEILVNENNDYKQRVDSLEDSHANLLSQLHKLQAMVSKQHSNKKA